MESITRPVAIFIRGLPGSGKSHIAEGLQEKIGQKNTVLLDPDTIDFRSDVYTSHVEKARAEGVDEKLFPYRFLRGRAYKAITDGKIILWNQPFTNAEIFAKMVARLRDHAAIHETSLEIIVVEVGINPEIAWKRIETRKAAGGHGPSHETFERFLHEYKTLADQGYKVLNVSGDDSTERSVSAIIDSLE